MEFNKIKLNVESKFGKKKKPFHHMRNLINLTQSWCKIKIETNKYELITEKKSIKKMV